MKRLTVYLGDGLYIQNPEEVDGKIVGDRRCLQRLAKYEDLFESWGIGELDFDELQKWHDRAMWHLKKCDEYARKIEAIENIIKESNGGDKNG